MAREVDDGQRLEEKTLEVFLRDYCFYKREFAELKKVVNLIKNAIM
jgi:hypothetical protein